jgi:hypothetical protein
MRSGDQRSESLCPESLCPECARPTGDSHVLGGENCPHCGSRLVREQLVRAEPSRWINVARVTNLAEAGFLVDELTGDGIDARIFQSEDFNALTDRWLVSYLIQSPPEFAQSAAAHIRTHLAEIESYQAAGATAAGATGDWSEERPAFDAQAWRPVALVVLAGVASLVLGQRFAADRDSKPPRNSLPRTVAAIGRPLVTEPAAGQPRHRLYYHWRDEAWYLDTDADGDGRFEAQQRFHAAGAAW